MSTVIHPRDYNNILLEYTINLAIVIEKLSQFNFDDMINLKQQYHVLNDMLFAFNKISLGSVIVNPRIACSFWQSFLNDYFHLCFQCILAAVSDEEVNQPQDVIDKRFKHKLWREHPYFNFISQAFLLLEKNSKTALHLADDYIQDEKTIHKAEFYLEQFLDALSPSNYILTNPEILQDTVVNDGKNLIEGLKNLQRDIMKYPDRLQMAMADYDYFQLGKNIAVTPGKVIYQNDLMQLIQYEPQTKKVYECPLLCIAAFVNKYYILDLSPENSLIDWLVKKGYTVFSISWVNPDASLADKEFQDYLLEGPITAIDVIKKVTRASSVNVVGYCLGGTMLACVLAYLSARNDHSIHSATYLTTVLDYANFGFFTDFIDEDQARLVHDFVQKQGYLYGYYLHQLFNCLRPNDLIWPYYVKNYLQGATPDRKEILYWNGDYTNIPPKVIDFCLRNLCMQNQLISANKINFNNTLIDLNLIKVPTYFFSAIRDHLSPWKSTYSGLHFHSGDTVFTLGDAGHVAGVVNPPDKNKYGYYINNGPHNNPESFLKDAIKQSGSWWPHWEAWLSVRSGEKVSQRKPGDDQFVVLEDAPGSYVKVQYAYSRQKG